MSLFRRAMMAAAGASAPPALPAPDLLHLDAAAGVTTVGAKVSAWADQSGNGFNALQGTDAARPTYSASVAALNGQPAVTWPSSGAIRMLLTGMTDSARDRTYVFVGDFKDADSSARLLECSSPAVQCGYLAAFGQYLHDGATRAGVAFSTGPSVLIYQHDAGTYRSWRGSTAGTPVACNAGRAIGGTIGLGARGTDGAVPMHGDLAAVYIYGSAIDSTQIAALLAYAAYRWGISP